MKQHKNRDRIRKTFSEEYSGSTGFTSGSGSEIGSASESQLSIGDPDQYPESGFEIL
jgi:hypothetical protein